jgi:lysophospholipase L1-like esterase
MLDCLIIGDSIAVGTKMFMKHCADYAKGGINTAQWNKQYKNQKLIARTLIISLGTNDHKWVKTYDELFEMRQRVDADRVYWVLPAGNLNAPQNLPIEEIQRIVREVAEYNGDTVLPINGLQPDGIHPSWAGYKDIAARAR